MGIRLVYGLKTEDVSYLESFYPSRRLAEAASALGLDFKTTIQAPGAPLQDAARFCEGHAALLRGELPLTLYEFLESRGVVVVNGAKSTALASDKWMTAKWLASIGAAHPETRLVDPAGMKPPLAPPFVAKPRFGKMGRGVFLVESAASWVTFIRSGEARTTEYLAQEYVEASRGRDARFFFARFGDGETGTPVSVIRRGDGLTSNAHTGGSMQPFDAPAPLRAEAARIFNASGLTYGTVDFLFSGEAGTSFTVCEINACPGFEALESMGGLDVAGAILLAAAGAKGAS